MDWDWFSTRLHSYISTHPDSAHLLSLSILLAPEWREDGPCQETAATRSEVITKDDESQRHMTDEVTDDW